jgi:YD repeat-containing protein
LKTAKQGTTTKESYTYDPVENRLSSLGVSPYNYNTSKLTSTPSGNYTYDNNGSRKSDPSGAQYSWDYENRLTQVILAGTGGTVTFKYDPFGRRAQKAFAQNGTTTTTNYFYDGPNLLEEVDNSGNVLGHYSGGPWIDEALGELRSGVNSYYEQDGVGSATSLSGSAGALANQESIMWGQTGHSCMFQALRGFGVESLSPEELADVFDWFCPCGREPYDPDALRKQRERFENSIRS